MIPDWLPKDAWDGFVAMRKKQKKPLTDRGADLIIKKLEGFRDKGHDVGEILDRSVENSWQGVFEPDRKATGKDGIPHLGKAGQATANNAQEWVEEAAPSEAQKKQQFAQLFIVLADYYKSECSRAMLMVMWEGLKQFDHAAIEKAAWAHTSNPDEAGRWMPKTSDLLKYMQGRTIDQASQAWAKVDFAIRCIGSVNDVAFDDPLIHAAINDLGGWIKVANCPSMDELPFLEKRFITVYQGYRMKSEKPAYSGRLTGSANLYNHSEGYTLTPVRLVGDFEKAKQFLVSTEARSLDDMRKIDHVVERG